MYFEEIFTSEGCGEDTVELRCRRARFIRLLKVYVRKRGAWFYFFLHDLPLHCVTEPQLQHP